MNERNLAIITKENFGEVECDFWKDENSKDIFMTTQQLGKALGYSNPQKGIDNLISRNEYLKKDEFSVTLGLRATDGKTYNTRVFTEDGIYEVTFLAKGEKAKEFRNWVRQILKGLRKGQLKLVPTNNYQLPQTYVEALEKLLETTKEIEQLKEENEVMIPKVEGYDKLINADNDQAMNTVAKSFGIGRNKLFAYLRNKEILMSNNMPYQRYLESKYFRVREFTIHTKTKEINLTQTLVTAKGLDYLKKVLSEVNYKIS